MTENKRFTLCAVSPNVAQIKKEDKILEIKEVVDLLNEQHEEKEELIDALNQRTGQCDKLNEENKRLQGRIQEYEEIIGGYIDENEEIRKKVNVLHEENQKLDKTIEELDNCQKGQSCRINDLYLENKQLKDLIIHVGYKIKYDGYRHISLELRE